jgi:hypothetical protein
MASGSVKHLFLAWSKGYCEATQHSAPVLRNLAWVWKGLVEVEGLRGPLSLASDAGTLRPRVGVSH